MYVNLASILTKTVTKDYTNKILLPTFFLSSWFVSSISARRCWFRRTRSLVTSCWARSARWRPTSLSSWRLRSFGEHRYNIQRRDSIHNIWPTGKNRLTNERMQFRCYRTANTAVEYAQLLLNFHFLCSCVLTYLILILYIDIVTMLKEWLLVLIFCAFRLSIETFILAVLVLIWWPLLIILKCFSQKALLLLRKMIWLDIYSFTIHYTIIEQIMWLVCCCIVMLNPPLSLSVVCLSL